MFNSLMQLYNCNCETIINIVKVNIGNQVLLRCCLLLFLKVNAYNFTSLIAEIIVALLLQFNDLLPNNQFNIYLFINRKLSELQYSHAWLSFGSGLLNIFLAICDVFIMVF